MKTVAIIPVKTFLTAKTRLMLPPEQSVELCKLMLEEVLKTLSTSKKIDGTIIVSHDQEAFDIGKKFDVIEIFDKLESGVNNAISVADEYIQDSEFDTSLVLPQDIPFIETTDLDSLFLFHNNTSVVIVPSRQFNGTNALLRNPAGIMKTRYDEGTFRSHTDLAKSKNLTFALALIQRLMLDIDTKEDLKFSMKRTIKPDLCKKISDLID